MISRITRLLILLQIAAACGVTVLAIKVAHIDKLWLALSVGFGSIYLLRAVITAHSFFLSWIYRSETPPEHCLNWHQTIGLFIEEFHATMLTTSWTMPFLPVTKCVAKTPVGLPVLLVHGYGCNSGYWHPLSTLLKQAHLSHHAVDLEPVLGDIDTYVPIVQRAITALCEETGHNKIVIVTHSMGGLVMRAYLREHGSDRIAKIISLGAPHRGTGVANFGIGINCSQMRWRGSAAKGTPSEWIRRLEHTEDKAAHALFVSLYSHHDNIVSPQTSSCLPCANNVAFHGIGHVALALNPLVQARVLEEILQTTEVQRL